MGFEFEKIDKMKFVKGDKVKFLNNVGGGVVVKVISKEMVEVRTDDDFEYPVMIDELIGIDEEVVNRAYGFTTEADKRREHENMFTNSGAPEEEEDDVFEEEEEDIFENPTDDINLFFAFVPTEERLKNANFMNYLVNDSNFFVMYNVYNTSSEAFWNKHGIIEPNSKEHLETFDRSKINELRNFKFQFLFFKNGKHDIKAAIDKDIKVNPKNFFLEKKFTGNDFFYEDSMVLPILTEDAMKEAIERLAARDLEEVKKLKAQNEKNRKSNKFRKNIQPVHKEKVVDLHIHELIDDESGLSRNEILEIQMERFRSELDDAVKKRIGRIVFIHGVGNGRLKMEVLKELKKPRYKKLSFQDASFKEYGYGATMVMV